MVRHCCGDKDCAEDLEIESDTAEGILRDLKDLSRTAVAEHFINCPESDKHVPPFPSEADFRIANEIGSALLDTAQRSPYLVRTAVSVYACGVRRSDKLLVLANPQHARFGRALIDLVRELRLKGLRWRIVGFKKDKDSRPSPRPVPMEWCTQLGIPSNTRMGWVYQKNKKNAASASQIAIEVRELRGRSLEVSSNFHSVMLVAAVVLFPDSIKQSLRK
jgi:hypothetical protein